MSRRSLSGSLHRAPLLPLLFILLVLSTTLAGGPARGSDVTPVEPDPLLSLSITSPYRHTITSARIRLSAHIVRSAPGAGEWTIELVDHEIARVMNFFAAYGIDFQYLGADDWMVLYQASVQPTLVFTHLPRSYDSLDIFFVTSGNTPVADGSPATACCTTSRAMGGMHLIHEVGHCLGLLHVDEPDGLGCPSDLDCRFCDDLVCDTPRLVSWPGCIDLTCPECIFGQGPYRNVMQTWPWPGGLLDWTLIPSCDCCRQEFTPEQVNRMLAMIEYSDILRLMVVTPITFDKRDDTGLSYAGTPYSSAPIDFDRDGLLDLIITIRAGAEVDFSRVYRNTRLNQNGVPQFRDRTGVIFNPAERPQPGLRGLAVADYNGDGWPDFFAAKDGTSRLYENNGDGTFTDRAAALLPAGATAGCWAAAWGDYDKDGQPDLLLVGGYDVNIDGDLGASDDPAPVILLRNQRPDAETFADVTVAARLGTAVLPLESASASVSWADVNLDGYLDFFVGSVQEFAGSPSLLYVSNCDSAFTFALATNDRLPDLDELQQVTGVAWADMDSDGDLDLVVSEQSDLQFGPRILWNDGSGWFTPSPPTVLPVSSPTTGLRPFDADLDGRTDLLLLPKLAADRPWLFTNKATPAGPYFVDETAAVQLVEAGRVDGAVAADYNGDGDFDLYLGRPAETNAFYYHNVQKTGQDAPAHRWVGLKLLPQRPANTEVGAVVTFTADDLVQTQIVDGGSGRGCQMDRTLICGLGRYEGPVTATIRWPNGVVQTAALTPGTVNAVVDETQIEILAGSVSIQRQIDPLSGAIDFTFRWRTNYVSHKALERIVIEAVPGPCNVGPAVVSPDSPGVTHYSQAKVAGGYEHELSWGGMACEPNCNYPYTIRSATDTKQGVISGTLQVKVCPTQ